MKQTQMEGQEKYLYAWRNIRKQWQREGRKQKQLVILEVNSTNVQVSCWQRDCCLWQKEKFLPQAWQEGEEHWWQQLQEVLLDVFIWARVPEMVDTIMILEEQLVFSEQLELPLLKEKQLLQALPWEAQQLVPWEEGTYNTAFAASEVEEDKLQVQLWAWPNQQAQRARAMTMELHLQLRGILVGLNKERVQQAWYKGYGLQNWSLHQVGVSWQERAAQLANSEYPKRFCKACLTLSLALYIVGQAGCYYASRSLESTTQEIEQYALWQQRMERSQRLEADLQRYRSMDKRMQENASHMSSTVQRIGQRLSAGCWLELLRGEGKSKEWQLEGACYGPEALHRLLENLEQDPKLTQVRLLNSQQQGQRLSFSLGVKENAN
ncbi:MAG: hypothetical protein ACI3WU_02335 [Phascolarctobacterium sp.]